MTRREDLAAFEALVREWEESSFCEVGHTRELADIAKDIEVAREKVLALDLPELGAAYWKARVDALLTANAADWDDDKLAEDDQIHAAFPTRSGRHDLYGEAMRLVGATYSKGKLVALVTWLLLERDVRDVRIVELEAKVEEYPDSRRYDRD